MNSNRLIGDLLDALSVAEHGSLNKAARALNISQPSLTRSIALLEQTLGGRLFERGPRGVRPTRLGVEMMEHARTIRAHAMQMRRSAAALRGEQAVSFHLVSAPVTPVVAFSMALLDVQAQLPALQIQVTIGPSAEMIRLLRSGDAGLAVLPLGETDQRGLLVEPIYHDAMAIYARSGHPLTARKRVEPAQLRQQQWILGPPGSRVRARIDELLAAQGAPPPRVAIEVDDVALRRSMVTHSDFLSAFQVHHVYNELRAGLIAKVPCRWPQEANAVGLLRLLPHSDVSLLFQQAFRRRFREAGMPVAS